MIKLYTKDKAYIGELTECSRAIAIEERNGMCEVEIDYKLFSPHWDKLVRGNIIEADLNDKITKQLFRIYKVTKDIMGHFTVYARHISFDLQRDYIDGINIENQSCEYCLNMLFRNSQFSQNFKGYSDIINAQNYKINNVNLLKAIAGEKGSIIDTFGTGAEIKRDNYDFYVLNKRGHDNGVVIEYASNLTGLDYEEDEEGLITRIRAIAKYTPKDEEGNDLEEVLIHTYVDSENIHNYETPFISEIDFSDKFEEDEIPTVEKLTTFANKYFKDNKCDIMKFNYEIEFIPLSKCVGYEGIQDQIELCDTVTIKDYRYDLNTQAKVVKTTYDILKQRYDSMELGEPRTSLGDIIGGGDDSTSGSQGPQGPQGPPGADGSIGDFPNTLPSTPKLSAKVFGFASIELSWTYENQVYYNYEIYASKNKGFTPNTFDIIHAGQTSSFLFQAKPNETWYFRACATNTHGQRTGFSDEIEVTTTKIDDLENYFTSAAIGNAVVGSLTSDYMEAGILKGHWIDAKNLSVTDGNGKRTLDIDSFGNVNLNVSSLKIQSSKVVTEEEISDTLLNTSIQYYLSTSLTSLSGGSWQDTAPTWTQGRYMWQRMKYTYKDGTTSYGTAICIAGATGVGVSSITNYYLATNSSTGVTTSTSGWTTTVQTVSSSKKYLWNYEKVTYTNGSTVSTTPCIIGNFSVDGTNGTDGVGISSITEYYQVSTSNTTVPTSWVTTPPTLTKTNKYLWNYEKITYTNNTTKETSKRVIGVYGDTGATGSTGDKGQSLVSSTPQWYLSSSKTSQTGGSWVETMPTITANKYLWLRYKLVWENPTSTTYTTPTLEQIAETVKDVQSTVTQTAEKLGWMVKSGTSESSMTLTDKMYSLISQNINLTADRINLNGYVNANDTFSIDTNGNVMLGDPFESAIYLYADDGAIMCYDSLIERSRIQNGQFRFQNNSGTKVGYVGANYWSNATSKWLTAVNADYGHTVGLGAQYTSGGNYVCSTIISSIGQLLGSYYYHQGTNINYGHFTSGLNIHSQRSSEEPNCAFIEATQVSGSGLRVYGNNYGLALGVRNNADLKLGLRFTLDSSQTNGIYANAYTPINMNNYKIYNSSISSTSDRTLKENIKYLDYNNINPNARTIESKDDISLNDMYDFINNDYILASYNYIGEDKKTISAVAQDLLVNMDGTDNKVGQLITHRCKKTEDCGEGTIIGTDTENGKIIEQAEIVESETIAINQTELLNITIGALQKACEKIESLERQIQQLQELNKTIIKQQEIIDTLFIKQN